MWQISWRNIMLRLFNTKSRKLEPLNPINDNFVTLYSCGPTVYNFYHIGNLRNSVFNDTLRRSLEIHGYKVKHVINITDIGHLSSDSDEGHDKLEESAKQKGKSVSEIADFYTNAYKSDMRDINNKEPNAYSSKNYRDHYARATEFIDEQIAMVNKILESGFAYITKQAIYFDISKITDYNVLNPQDTAEKQVAARNDVVQDADKRSPYDFALWFFATGRFKNHTMRWPSPWGEGFPGWHLECSAIIHAVLGDPIDIHTGGIDHIGTHHPNEIAQTKAAYNNQLANYWVHNNFMLVDGEKMSKSKNNAYTLADIKARHFSALDYRLLVLQAHYATELNFSWNNLQAAAHRLLKWRNAAILRFQPVSITQPNLSNTISDAIEECKQALFDNLDTPKVLSIIDGVFDEITEGLTRDNIPHFEDFLFFVDESLGLNLLKTKDITSAASDLLEERNKARLLKNWEKADQLRTQLNERGYEVKDSEGHNIWQLLK